MRSLSFFLFLLFLLSACSEPENITPYFETPLQQSDYSALTLNKEMGSYLSKTDSLSFVNIDTLYTTPAGRIMPVVKLFAKGEYKPDKITVMIFAGQHGNEPSGKEGVLLWLNGFINGSNDSLLNKMNILLLPAVNPDGLDLHQRRTVSDIDPNRDHLLLHSPEVAALHRLFKEYQPEFTVDIHEYYPYRESWYKFGYLKQFDIQLGVLTNPNVDSVILNISKTGVLPYVQQYLESRGYSFGEYIVGSLAYGDRLRHSTADINDGRQSMGIQNTFSFIVEGLNGKDSLQNIRRRAESQKETVNALLSYAYLHTDEIKAVSRAARAKLLTDDSRAVGIKLEHFKGNKPLKYQLRSLSSGMDTVFEIDEYHCVVKSLAQTSMPRAYLIPPNDTALLSLLRRHSIKFEDYKFSVTDSITAYRIKDIRSEVVEELDIRFPVLEKKTLSVDSLFGYKIVRTNNLKALMLVTALEPESNFGLVNYSEFNYLLREETHYPILRLE